MRRVIAIGLFVSLLSGLRSFGVDFSQVDRSIGREPTYKDKPSCCLLVFGPEANTRVWLVQDGERICVDRNADGDLTGSNEAFLPSERREFTTTPYRSWIYAIGEIVPANGSRRHTDFKLTRYQKGDSPADYILSVKVNGKLQQVAGWAPIFSEIRGEASVVHFGGPMVVQPLRDRELSLSSKKPELHIRFATPGSGKSSFASLAYQSVPANVHPRAEIEWPASDSAPAQKTVVMLEKRC